MDSRKQRILHAVIKEYVSTAVPVGSKTLCENYELGCSPATVRSELAALEELGYLTHPHTSAGRVPTDKGYRLFVDSLVSMREALSKGAIPDFIGARALHSSDIHNVIRTVTRALSSYTRCLTLARTPSLNNTTVKKLELLSLGGLRALFVLVASNGQVLNRTLELPFESTPETLSNVQHSLNIALDGKPAREVRLLRDALRSDERDAYLDHDELMVLVLDEIIDALEQADHESVHHGGVAELLAQPEFSDVVRAQAVVDAVEQGLDIVELLDSFDASEPSTLQVLIGNENNLSAFGESSLVISSYQRDGALGFIGVVGPTRMNYTRSIAAVMRAAHMLSDTQDEGTSLSVKQS